MTQTLTPEPLGNPRPSLSRYFFWVVGVLCLVVLVIAVGMQLLDHIKASDRTRKVLARLDEEEPGWRLEDIRAKQVNLSAKDNSALVIEKVGLGVGNNWPSGKVSRDTTSFLPRQYLPVETRPLIEADFKKVESERALALSLADLPRGRHDVDLLPNSRKNSLVTRWIQNTGELLKLEIHYQVNGGDVTAAIRSCRALVNTGRSFYDEPGLRFQSERSRHVVDALRRIEKVLSFGECEDVELAALEQLLRDEERHPTDIVGVQGERALRAHYYLEILSGGLPMPELRSRMSWWSSLQGLPRLIVQEELRNDLEHYTELLRIVRLPVSKQAKELNTFASRYAKKESPLSGLSHGVNLRVSEKSCSIPAMRLMLAAERYRMKYGKWPGRAEDVVPEFLETVPIDPCDEKPIRMRRIGTTMVFYSIGEDGVDGRGIQLTWNPGGKFDLGYRLYDLPVRPRFQRLGPPTIERPNPE